MKKALSIFFVCLIVLNTGGYYLFFAGVEYKHNLTQNRKLSVGQFSGSYAIIIKVAVPSSSAPDDDEYQPREGKLMYQGELYRLVKAKKQGEVVYVVCVRDQTGAAIRDVMTELSRQFADFEQDDRKPVTSFSFVKDYCASESRLEIRVNGALSLRVSEMVVEHYAYSPTAEISKPPVTV